MPDTATLNSPSMQLNSVIFVIYCVTPPTSPPSTSTTASHHQDYFHHNLHHLLPSPLPPAKILAYLIDDYYGWRRASMWSPPSISTINHHIQNLVHSIDNTTTMIKFLAAPSLQRNKWNHQTLTLFIIESPSPSPPILPITKTKKKSLNPKIIYLRRKF